MVKSIFTVVKPLEVRFEIRFCMHTLGNKLYTKNQDKGGQLLITGQDSDEVTTIHRENPSL